MGTTHVLSILEVQDCLVEHNTTSNIGFAKYVVIQWAGLVRWTSASDKKVCLIAIEKDTGVSYETKCFDARREH